MEVKTRCSWSEKVKREEELDGNIREKKALLLCVRMTEAYLILHIKKH